MEGFTIEEETPDGKLLIYDTGKYEDLDQVAQLAARYFSSSTPIVELASIGELHT